MSTLANQIKILKQTILSYIPENDTIYDGIAHILWMPELVVLVFQSLTSYMRRLLDDQGNMHRDLIDP